jgi:hypothetical protein
VIVERVCYCFVKGSEINSLLAERETESLRVSLLLLFKELREKQRRREFHLLLASILQKTERKTERVFYSKGPGERS